MSQVNLWKFSDTSSLTGFTVVIPSVAVGNVGQLACDLLISSFGMKKFATVYSPAIVPVAGYDPYDLKSSSVSTSCEAYKSESKKIVVLQIRAPLVYKLSRNFLEDVITQFKKKDVRDIIVLTSSYAHEKKHIMTSPFRYVTNESCIYKNKITLLNWVAHEEIDSHISIYGGGFASLLFDICKESDIPCLILYKYCSEGDNIPDAYDMVNYLTGVLPLFSEQSDLLSQLIQPVSWKLLFGRPPPGDIY